jgi:hypothetical protein
MPLVLADRVQETTTSTGTGTITLAGASVGFNSFSVIGNGNTTYYTIAAAAQWEVGIGTYTASGTTLSRDTVLSSSNGGALVDFSAGSKNVFVTYPAERAVYEDASGNIASLAVTDINVTNANVATLLTTTNANVTTQLTATNTNVTTQLTATNANVTTRITATNANVTTLLTATNANVTTQLTATNINASVNIVSANYENTGVFYYNAKTVTANTTIDSTENALSVGPITIADGITVTINDGGEWSIV